MKLIKKYKYYILSLLCIVAILTWLPILAHGKNIGLRVWFFDVGQGDAVFLDFFDGNQVLIDGGPGNKILQKLGKAMPFYDRSIDLIILTHPHKDHVFGLIEVIKRYEIGKIVLPNVDFDSVFYGEFLEIARDKNIPLEYLAKGDEMQIGEFAEFDFLSPGASVKTKSNNFTSDNESFGARGRDLNNQSLVTRFIFGSKSILFTGDAGEGIEKNILADGYDLKSDILKVGHHGSKYSSSEEFIKSANAQYAVIQSGADNRYGHPAEQTLNRLLSDGAKIYRSDLDGDIVFESDGNNLISP